ncbi:WD40-repeat-containing domain [Phytophthora cactorum]|nr:WD40-repeat-containing domain [Phytophthora cactorum]
MVRKMRSLRGCISRYPVASSGAPYTHHPLRLDIKRKLSSRSERVKSVDLHPTEPWVLSALYSGSLMIWNYATQSLVKTLEVSSLPVRNAKFVARKQWIIASSDDMQVRVFNYNTMEKVTSFEAHSDYIRHIENFTCTQVFEGHGHYVMMVKFNPKDAHSFASACLDRTVRVWGLGSSHAHFSLEGHEKGVNCVAYYPGGDKPYLLSGSDDHKSHCPHTGRPWNNLTSVLYHPRLPLIISACEDGAVRMWHSTTYRAETTLNYGMERSWSLAALPSANTLAIGYDEGTIVLRLGHDTPVVSMDAGGSGKLIWTTNNDVHTASIKGVVAEMGLQDGEKLPLVSRDLGSCEVYPQKVQHNSNGRYVVVCGDGEYIIYTAQQLRNKAFGAALDFCCISKLTLFRNFKEVKSEKPRVLSAEGLFGGAGAIGVKGNDAIAMFDWEELRLIRKIDVVAKNVFWSENGSLVVLACESSFFVLRYNKELVAQAFAAGTNTPEEGVDGAFDLLHEISEKVGTGRGLNYYVGGEVMTLAHLEQKMYLLGYLPRENLVFLMDKMKNVVSYTVSLVMLEYQTAVVRRDFESANAILPKIPADQMDYVARFLESQGFKEEALALSTDPDQKFDLAVQLAKLDVARDIMLHEIDKGDKAKDMDIETQHKWKQLGDLALNDCQLALAEDCALRADDFSLLLILYTSRGDKEGLVRLAGLAREKRRYNIAFICWLLLGKTTECVEMLKETKRFPEAAFFARSYCPSKMQLVMDKWREDLAAVSSRAAKALADPTRNAELFENLELSMQAEATLLAQNGGGESNAPAASYLAKKKVLESENILELILSGGAAAAFTVAVSDTFHDTAAAAQLAYEQAQAQAAAEAEAQLRAEEEARQRAEAEAQARAMEEAARLRAEQEAAAAQAQAEAEAELQRQQAAAMSSSFGSGDTGFGFAASSGSNEFGFSSQDAFSSSQTLGIV